jgi:hypothetical protein
MKVRLLTSRWDQRGPKGIVRRRRGDQFTVKDDVADWLLRSGAAEQVGRAPSAARTADEEQAPVIAADVIAELDDEDPDERPVDEDDDLPDDAPESERPAQSAPKADWVAYAVSRGIPAKEAEGMDKQKLISRAA